MTNKIITNNNHTFRPLSELNIIDDFLFQQLLSQEGDGEEFCRILLSTILGRPIRKVRITPQKNILGIDTNQHGIRLDAYIEEIPENDLINSNCVDAEIIPDIYDIEPNNHYERKSLPKRMRYYHGLIDTQLLATNVDYEKLPNVVIIVILPYDPFGKNRMVYTIQNQCVEDTTLSYNDGATKIFLYTKGTKGNPSQELRDMLKCIEETTTDNIANQNIGMLHRLVEKVKQRKEVGINYMKSWELEKMWKQEGVEEGLAQGLEQGLEQGLTQGCIETCQEFQLSKADTLNKIMQKFSLDQETATAYIEKYWKN